MVQAILIAGGSPNTCAFAPKPPAAPPSPSTCGLGVWQAWAAQVRTRRFFAVPPTRRLRVPIFLFRRTSPESLYINPSHHNEHTNAGRQWSPECYIGCVRQFYKNHPYLVRKGQCGTSFIPYLVMERYSTKASRSSTGITMVMVFFQGNLRFSRFSTNRYPAKIPK
jgi:hypothetical protein